MTMDLRTTAIAIVLGFALVQINPLPAASDPAFGNVFRASAGEKTGPSKEAIAKAETALKDHLEKAKATGGQIVHLQTAALAKEFPDDIFFALRLRLFP